MRGIEKGERECQRTLMEDGDTCECGYAYEYFMERLSDPTSAAFNERSALI
jgi:hypothetical protein